MKPLTPDQLEHRPRRRGIVHVHAVAGALVALCGVCGSSTVQHHSSPAEARLRLPTLVAWGRSHATTHREENT